ncbi:MAG: hypothetical protein U1E53_08260 [Dongiaceae bacterium]
MPLYTVASTTGLQPARDRACDGIVIPGGRVPDSCRGMPSQDASPGREIDGSACAACGSGIPLFIDSHARRMGNCVGREALVRLSPGGPSA